MTKKDLPWEALAKYFAGELTDPEKTELTAWLHSNPEVQKQLPELQKIWENSGSLPYQLNVDEAWEALSAKMDVVDREKPYEQRQTAKVWQMPDRASTKTGTLKVLYLYDQWKLRRTHQNVQSVASVAAAILLVLTGTFFFSTHSGVPDKNEVVMRQYEIGEGKRATYTLGDGTKVILHAESRLELPETFTENSREITLDGMAWFEVAPDAERPFIVRSGNSRTRVIGTKFMIEAWPDAKESPNAEIVVAEGTVAFGAVDDPSNEVVINKNQKAVLNGNQPPIVSQVEDLTWHLGWTNGRLVFDNRSLNEIIPKLERWYVLDIHVEESVGNRRLSAEIDYDQPMTEVLYGIALSLDLNMEREDRQIRFSEKK